MSESEIEAQKVKFQVILDYMNSLPTGNDLMKSEESFWQFKSLLTLLVEWQLGDGFSLISDSTGHVSLPKIDCGDLLANFYPAIAVSGVIEEYFGVTRLFLQSENVFWISKTHILRLEEKYIKNFVWQSFFTSNEGRRGLSARLELCRNFMNTQPKVTNAHIRFSAYLTKLIEGFVDKGQMLQGSAFLTEMLKKSESAPERKILVRAIVDHDIAFNLTAASVLNSLIDEYGDVHSTDELEQLRRRVSHRPEGLDMKFFEFTIGELSNQSLRGKEIQTSISFSIPHSCVFNIQKNMAINFDDPSKQISIRFTPIFAFWQDPIFKVARNFVIGGVDWRHYVEAEKESYTHVEVFLNGLFAPDVKLEDERFTKIDFSEKEALDGREFYPHKTEVIRLFRLHFESIEKAIDIKKSDLNVDLFSNYLVQYVDKKTKQPLHRKLAAMTSPNSFSNAVSSFRERLDAVNLGDSDLSVRELCAIKIESERNLQKFFMRCLDVTLKHIVENHGGYKYLWKKGDENLIPLSERESQPYIFGQLKSICDFMGIQLSREVETGNGELDFLVSYTSNINKLLRVCVELKLDSQKIEAGLINQLPAYMKSERTKYGVYLVLWYKSAAFNSPKRYASPKELKSRLNDISPDNKISSTIINCTKPIYPSKL